MTDDRERARLYQEAGWGWWMSDEDPFAAHIEPAHPATPEAPVPQEFRQWEAHPESVLQRLAALFRRLDTEPF